MFPNETVEYFYDQNQRKIVSDQLVRILQIVNIVVLCQAFVIFGSITNILNMIVFVRIGFSDTINLSLMALAFSDFGACFMLILWSVAINPWVQQMDSLSFDPNISYLTLSWPHVFFSRVTSLLTAFISFERCVCVTMPLNVKSIVTRKRVKIMIACSYTLVIISCIPVYYTTRIGWKFYPRANRSRLGLIFREDKEEIENIFFPIFNILFSYFSFAVIAVSTVILVTALRRNSKRMQTMNVNKISTKESKVSKMVIMVSMLFVFCFAPNVVSMMIMMADNEVSMGGRKMNLLRTFAAFSFLLVSVNSSCNIFIYYHNSSIYKTTFRKIFHWKPEDVSAK